MLVNLYANDLFAEIFETGENNDGIKRDFEIFELLTFLTKTLKTFFNGQNYPSSKIFLRDSIRFCFSFRTLVEFLEITLEPQWDEIIAVISRSLRSCIKFALQPFT